MQVIKPAKNIAYTQIKVFKKELGFKVQGRSTK